MKKKTFLKGIQYLQDSRFPGNHEFTNSEKDTWYLCLGDLDDQSFLKAVKDCIMTSQFFPTIAEIRERAMGDPVMSAEEAWNEVLVQKTDTCGIDRTAVFSSKVIEDIVSSLGGINEIWLAGTKNEGYFRKLFIDAFKSRQSVEKKRLMVGSSERKAVDDGRKI